MGNVHEYTRKGYISWSSFVTGGYFFYDQVWTREEGGIIKGEWIRVIIPIRSFVTVKGLSIVLSYGFAVYLQTEDRLTCFLASSCCEPASPEDNTRPDLPT